MTLPLFSILFIVASVYINYTINKYINKDRWIERQTDGQIYCIGNTHIDRLMDGWID